MSALPAAFHLSGVSSQGQLTVILRRERFVLLNCASVIPQSYSGLYIATVHYNELQFGWLGRVKCYPTCIHSEQTQQCFLGLVSFAFLCVPATSSVAVLVLFPTFYFFLGGGCFFLFYFPNILVCLVFCVFYFFIFLHV